MLYQKKKKKKKQKKKKKKALKTFFAVVVSYLEFAVSTAGIEAPCAVNCCRSGAGMSDTHCASH